MDRFDLGWNTALDPLLEKFQLDRFVRITEKHKTAYRAITTNGAPITCYLPGRLLHNQISSELPAVGDWCIIGEHFLDESNNPAATITEVVPRYSKVSRMSAGTDSAEQLLAANVDFVFIVTSLNRDLNLNRIQRFVLLSKSGNTSPVILLSKADLCEQSEIDGALEAVQKSFPELLCLPVSSTTKSGLDELYRILLPGQTAVFIGSSGVGKSTLVNTLLEQEIQATHVLRNNEKGRHTTTHSGLFHLPNGAMLIDTPGLREVQVLGELEDLNETVPEISEFAENCKFADCTHKHEPGCAVLSALEDGSLSEHQYSGYIQLEREIAYARRKLDARAQSAERRKWKQITMDARRRARP